MHVESMHVSYELKRVRVWLGLGGGGGGVVGVVLGWWLFCLFVFTLTRLS